MSNDDRPNVLLDRSIWGPLFPSLRPLFPSLPLTDEQREVEIRLATRRSMSNAPKPEPSQRSEVIQELMRQLEGARSEIDCLTEERDNARTNADHFAAMLNQRAAPKPEPTPDGALAPIPRDSALGNKLAALRAAQ